jgi:hypothetical protein
MSDNSDRKEQRILAAIAAYNAQEISSLRQAAKLFDVPVSTLHDRYSRKHKANKVSKQHLQRLSPEEEEAVVKAIYQLDVWGWPMTISAMENLATQLLLAKGDSNPLGKCWYSNFLARHPDLKTRRSRALDQSRKDALDHQTLEQWFNLYQTVRLMYGIVDDDVYNMDEKGCMKGIGDNQKVIVPRREGETFSTQPGNREWVSIIECISALGYLLPPFVIFEGSRIQHAWIPDDLDGDTVIQVSPNGWTDCNIALNWIQHFDKYTAPRTVGKYRLLILDGHASHISPQFVEYCATHNIVPLCLPPHSTHELQPLDVGVFGPLAKKYRVLVSQTALFGAVRINNYQFLLIYQQARKTIRHNIPGAWRGAGLIPFNPQKLLDRYRPKTPPFASITDCYGRRVDIPVTGELASKINDVVDDLFQVCSSPLKKKVTEIKNEYLTMQADLIAVTALNQELVNKARQRRKQNSKKYCGEARVLTVEEVRNKIQEREQQDAEEQRAKARRAALRGVVGFAKLVWKEMPVQYGLFD